MSKQSRTPRFVSLVLFLSLLSLCTVQCGAEDAPARPEVAPATVHWVTWDTTSQAEATLVEQFRESYPHVEFKRDSLNSNWQTLLSQSPLPDLVNMDADYEFEMLIRQNRVADLTELWDEAGLLEQVPASLQKLTEQDGKQFYVPFGFGWVGVYYNKGVFAQYNLQPPQTWDEFIAICDTLRANGETPLSIGGSEPWSSYGWFEYMNLRLNGPQFHRDLLRGKEHYDDARVRAVMEQWKLLFDNAYYVENPQLMGGLNAVAALMRNEKARTLTREKAVMVLSDAYNVSQLPTLFLDELAFFRFPTMDANVPAAEAVDLFGYLVPVGADHTPQALAFLAHLSTPAAQAIVAQEGLFSSVTYAPARADVDLEQLRFDQRQALELLQATDEAVPQMWLALPDEVWGMMTYEFSRFVREPHDIEIFMQRLEEIRQKAVASGKLSGE
ncbi:MAG: ABC transporter substrate-binding protein [Caldilineaceae bacterium]